VAAAASLPLSSLFRWRLARVKRGVVIGSAEMSLLGRRFKARERDRGHMALIVGIG
jgi:hypothetical protein